MLPTAVPLDNPIQNYAWGSRTAIAAFLGRPAPGVPEAELWIGAHPVAPSKIGKGAGTLDRLIEDDPKGALGLEVAGRFGSRLPFLLKIIAAAEPLSIQCHPDLDQARDGFARENAAGLPLDSAVRNYRDASHKPELAVALTRLLALKGFRPTGEIVSGLRPLGLAALDAEIEALERDGAPTSLERLFSRLLTLDARTRAPMIESAMALVRRRPPEPSGRLALRLQERYPGDAGVLSPFLLNLIDLAPEEALFLAPGELHAYVEGTALELMANSDNVLRGGLTPKHVDVPELLRVATFASGPPGILRPEALGGNHAERVYRTPAREFELALVEAREGAPLRRSTRGPELLLGLSGTATLEAAGATLSLGQGRSAFVPAALSEYRIQGEGRIARASVPG